MADALFPYQQRCSDSVIGFVRKSIDPALLDMCTAAGKSHIAADISKWFVNNTDRQILNLAPSKELIEQNYEKFTGHGFKASFFSASTGSKCAKHRTIYGTPGTVVNNLRRFSNTGCIILDEAHEITPTIRKIYDGIREYNPAVRFVGMTGTPYRTGEGYIYRHHFRDGYQELVSDKVTPFFHTLVDEVHGPELLELGRITRPKIVDVSIAYDTSKMKLKASGKWDEKTVEEAFHGRGRLTSQIVNDIVERSQDARGVMIFCASIHHAKEVLESCPEGAVIVTGDTPKAERSRITAAIKAQKIKYVINVGVYTTGFDAPHIDVIALMRKSESAGLITQINGRGMRVYPGKEYFSILDYADNIKAHYYDNDIFRPKITVKKKGEDKPRIKVHCPMCSHVNKFGAKGGTDNVNDYGFYYRNDEDALSYDTDRLIAAHVGRRCQGEVLRKGRHEQCTFMWNFKQCLECDHQCDPSSRICPKCKGELIDPNDKLVFDQKRADKEAKEKAKRESVTVRKVVGVKVEVHQPEDKAQCVRVSYTLDETQAKVSDWFYPLSEHQWLVSKWNTFCVKCFGAQLSTFDDVGKLPVRVPTSISFRRDPETKYPKDIKPEWPDVT